MAEPSPHLRRLESLLGARVAEAKEEHFRGLVDRGAREDEDLDFKQAHYQGPEAGFEFGKDVAALANARGGAIVLGIGEVDAIATVLTPVELADVRERTLQQWAAERVVPPVYITVTRVTGSAPDKGLYVVGVPRSSSRPHAVRAATPGLRWPLRRGTMTVFMSESELANAYRDRFTAAEASVAALERVLGQLPNLDAESIWLVVTVVPLQLGHVAMSRALEETLRAWATETARTMPPGTEADGLTTRPAFRRVGIRSWVGNDGAVKAFCGELYQDGSALFADRVGRHPGDGGVAEIYEEMLARRMISLLRFCACHPVDNVGLAGDAVAVARIYRPGAQGNMQLTRLEGNGFTHRFPQMASGLERAEMTVDLTGLASSWPDVVAASRNLLSQLHSGYGSAEPTHIDPVGELRILFFDQSTRTQLREWAKSTGVATTEVSTA